jgi:hypothetical protein
MAGKEWTYEREKNAQLLERRWQHIGNNAAPQAKETIATTDDTRRDQQKIMGYSGQELPHGH